MNRRDLLLSGAALAAGSVLTAESALAEDRKVPAKVPAKPKGPRLVLRRANERGVGRHGGRLEARYTF